MLLNHWEVIVVIEMVVGEKDGWEVHKVGKVVIRDCRKAKSAELEFAFVSSFGLNILGPLCLWQCLICFGGFPKGQTNKTLRPN